MLKRLAEYDRDPSLHRSFSHEWRREPPASANHKEAYDPAEDGGLRLIGYGRIGIHCTGGKCGI